MMLKGEHSCCWRPVAVPAADFDRHTRLFAGRWLPGSCFALRSTLPAAVNFMTLQLLSLNCVITALDPTQPSHTIAMQVNVLPLHGVNCGWHTDFAR